MLRSWGGFAQERLIWPNRVEDTVPLRVSGLVRVTVPVPLTLPVAPWKRPVPPVIVPCNVRLKVVGDVGVAVPPS